MSDIVIKAECLGKKYLIGHQAERERYTALRDVLVGNVRDYWRKARSLAYGAPIVQGDEQEEIWALRDVSFEVRQGDAVGIIGRNGAGKSTLLKILSRITEPSAGRVTIKGRVASLLEVGTGFHPELTGRENIYLNGAILGMTHKEIKYKFDEIVDFAEVEKFLDTPVKRYSSGMYMRLAFAVAAHLEPEILVVDEILAVGDSAFQKKSIGKMQDIASCGRTVVLVSHNMSVIRNMTTTAILLNNGMIVGINNSPEIIEQYLRITKVFSINHSDLDERNPHIRYVELFLSSCKEVNIINHDEDAYLVFKIHTAQNKRLIFGFTIFNLEDIGVFSGITSDEVESIPASCSELRIKLPSKFLNPGEYRVEGALLEEGRVIEQNERYFTFSVNRNNRFDLMAGKPRGLLRLSEGWEFN